MAGVGGREPKTPGLPTLSSVQPRPPNLHLQGISRSKMLFLNRGKIRNRFAIASLLDSSHQNSKVQYSLYTDHRSDSILGAVVKTLAANVSFVEAGMHFC